MPVACFLARGKVPLFPGAVRRTVNGNKDWIDGEHCVFKDFFVENLDFDGAEWYLYTIIAREGLHSDGDGA